MACYLEQFEAEVKDSKFDGQRAALRQRLEDAVQALAGDFSIASTRMVAEAAGYFRAAASSVGPLPKSTGENFNFTIS